MLSVVDYWITAEGPSVTIANPGDVDTAGTVRCTYIGPTSTTNLPTELPVIPAGETVTVIVEELLGAPITEMRDCQITRP